MRDGDVGHEVLVVGTVPVLLTVGREVNVAGTELHDALAACLDETAAFGDVERLAAFVGVPGRAGAGGEVHCADVDRRVITRLEVLSIQTSPVNHSAGPFTVGFLGRTPTGSPSRSAFVGGLVCPW